MVQDIWPHKLDNGYHDLSPEPDDTVFLFSEGKMMTRLDENGLSFPKLSDFDSLSAVFHYLFRLDESRCFLAVPDAESRFAAKGYEMLETSCLRGAMPHEAAFAGITAAQLDRWYRDNVFCGRCGGKLTPDHAERMLHCPSCGNMIYPKISPCVIVAITDGNRLLLTKYARGYARYALVAGFCEIGESFEETLRREVMEEVGLEVENIRYWKSQPWSFSDTLLAGFFCDVTGDRTPKLNDGELKEATWFEREEIPCTDDGVSLTRALIEAFKNHQEI